METRINQGIKKEMRQLRTEMKGEMNNEIKHEIDGNSRFNGITDISSSSNHKS